MIFFSYGSCDFSYDGSFGNRAKERASLNDVYRVMEFLSLPWFLLAMLLRWLSVFGG